MLIASCKVYHTKVDCNGAHKDQDKCSVGSSIGRAPDREHKAHSTSLDICCVGSSFHMAGCTEDSWRCKGSHKCGHMRGSCHTALCNRHEDDLCGSHHMFLNKDDHIPGEGLHKEKDI